MRATKDIDDELKKNPLCMHACLLELVEHFESLSAIKLFRSTDARAKDSMARALLESGRDWAHQLNEFDLARVLFASIIIGAGTLHKYLNVLVGEDKKRTDIIHRKLKDLLRYDLGLHDLYAKWLSENFHRLNDSSVNLLASLDKDSYQYVRVSTICSFDYAKQLALFKFRAKNIYGGLKDDRLNVFEAAMTHTSNKNVTLDMNTLGKAIMSARDMPKLEKDKRDRFKTITLDKWDEELRKGN